MVLIIFTLFLTGYKDAPEGYEMNSGMYYNEYFAGHQIAMPTPLIDGQVTYADGTESTVDQMAHDVTTFLAWASEPSQDDRKRMGWKVLIFPSLLLICSLQSEEENLERCWTLIFKGAAKPLF